MIWPESSHHATCHTSCRAAVSEEPVLITYFV